MRKVKPRMTKKERANFKKEKLERKIYGPLTNTVIFLSTFVDYLQEHRDLYNNKETYIKPYLKGYLTSVINQIKKLVKYDEQIKDNLFYEESKQIMKVIIEEDFETELKADKKFRKEFFEKENEVNCKLYKTYACATVCIATLKDMFIKKEKNPIYNEYKKILGRIFKEFKVYDDFWQREIEETDAIII